ncbi:MAG: hypothetical protein JW838_14820 [Spirochaetes bacterium]|nr:hypothetical protein [Spirochaetota bacterium]
MALQNIIHGTVPRLAASGIIAAAGALPLALSFFTEDGMPPAVGLLAGPLAGIGTLAGGYLLMKSYPLAAGSLMALAAAALIFKPLVAPVIWLYIDQPQPFSYTSETHLYFVLPGIMLAIVFIIALAAGKIIIEE